MARNIHTKNAIEGKNKKDAMPSKNPLLKTAAFAFGWL
jgi:hypothetical protein